MFINNKLKRNVEKRFCRLNVKLMNSGVELYKTVNT